jgi:hypothetical protein
MGRIGEQNPLFYCHGKMKAIQISRGERYSSDFQPEERFSPDSTAILIYAPDSVERRNHA